MTKNLIYKDEFGNEIDANTIEGIHTIFNDILSTYKTENACMYVKENIKASAEKCYKTRVQEIQTGEKLDKNIL